jgi:acetyltransferase-like isoleucine patch superfamily enzyme
VNKDVPANAVVAGVPARVVKLIDNASELASEAMHPASDVRA